MFDTVDKDIEYYQAIVFYDFSDPSGMEQEMPQYSVAKGDRFVTT